MHELLYKRDKHRSADLMKLHLIEGSLVRLPGIGEMFRAETRERRPAQSVLRAERIELSVPSALGTGEPFQLSDRERRSMDERTRGLKNGLPTLVEFWRSFGSKIESLRDSRPSEIPKLLAELAQGIRDRETMRRFYGNHRHANYPAPELIDEQWALFRWIQIYLFAGLDFFGSYGLLKAEPNPEKLFHERIDLDYTIPALLVGGLACCEKRIIRRFKFLRPDGFILRHRTN